jgi:hypothetical protein
MTNVYRLPEELQNAQKNKRAAFGVYIYFIAWSLCMMHFIVSGILALDLTWQTGTTNGIAGGGPLGNGCASHAGK